MPSTTANRSPKSGSADKSAVKQQLVQRLPYLRRYARALALHNRDRILPDERHMLSYEHPH